MNITQQSICPIPTQQQSPLVVGSTVPNPMDSEGGSDRRLTMVWRATGKPYPKMEAHWVYADEIANDV